MKKAKFIFMTLFVFVTMGISSLAAQNYVDVQEAATRLYQERQVLENSFDVLAKNNPQQFVIAKLKHTYYLALQDAIKATGTVEEGVSVTPVPNPNEGLLEVTVQVSKQDLTAFPADALALLKI